MMVESAGSCCIRLSRVRSYQSWPGDRARRAMIVALVIGHQDRVVDDVGIGLIGPVVVVERRGLGDDPVMRREGRRQARQEILQILVRALAALPRNRSSRPGTCWRRRKSMIWSSSWSLRARSASSFASPGAVPFVRRDILDHRQDGDAGLVGAHEVQPALVDPGAEFQVGPVQGDPERHHPVQVFERRVSARASWIVLARCSWCRSRSPAAGLLAASGWRATARLGSALWARRSLAISSSRRLRAAAASRSARASRPGFWARLTRLAGRWRRPGRSRPSDRRRQGQAGGKADRDDQEPRCPRPRPRS